MIGDDDSPDDPGIPETTDRRLTFGSPRFARLVQSPVARRFAPRRLALALSVGGLVAWGVYAGGVRVAGGLSSWVASRPEHQIPFEAIELIPAPPAFIRAEAAGILDEVRLEARYGPTLPVLTTDLETLRLALSRNPWIESAGPLRSSYRHIDAHVTYRKPLALLVHDEARNEAVLIDRNGVELPSTMAFRWAEKKNPRYRLAGDPAPLIEIWGLGHGVPDRVGLVWRSEEATKIPESRVIDAVHLAEFLAARAESKTAGGRPFPTFIKIHYEVKISKLGEVSGYFLLDSRHNWILWDSSPGEESLDELSSAEKWVMLGRFIDANDGFDLHGSRTDFLQLDRRGAIVHHPRFGMAGPR